MEKLLIFLSNGRVMSDIEKSQQEIVEIAFSGSIARKLQRGLIEQDVYNIQPMTRTIALSLMLERNSHV